MNLENEVAEIKAELKKLQTRIERVLKDAPPFQNRDPKPQTRKPNLTTR
jgi:hypothetical protein